MIDKLEVLNIIQDNINICGGYNDITTNEIVKDLLDRLNIDYSEIDFTPQPWAVFNVFSYNEYSFSILDRKDDSLVLLVTEKGHWFDYRFDKIEIIKEIPKDYDKNAPYYSPDNPLNINDKFIFNDDLFIVDEYMHHCDDIFASRVVEAIEVLTSDLEYNFDYQMYYYDYKD